jgi:hypothetical protein
MVTVKTLFTATAVLLLAILLPNAAQAQKAKEATALRIGAPDHANLGERVTVQAVLADSAGKPIAKATIYFVTPASFLSGSGDMLLAQAVTDKNGQAVTEFENNVAGALNIRAEFRGDDRYAPADAETQINIAGEQQVYVQHVGVHIPGLNEAPPAPVVASLERPFAGVTPDVQALWPSLSGWPVALVLMIVWSLYVFAVVLIFRIAAASPQKRGGYNVETGRFE